MLCVCVQARCRRGFGRHVSRVAVACGLSLTRIFCLQVLSSAAQIRGRRGGRRRVSADHLTSHSLTRILTLSPSERISRIKCGRSGHGGREVAMHFMAGMMSACIIAFAPTPTTSVCAGAAPRGPLEDNFRCDQRPPDHPPLIIAHVQDVCVR